MKIAYLIFAYKNPKLIQKTIDVLSSEDAAFFLHIDKKVDSHAFSSISSNDVFFISDPIPVYWGEFSGVRAILKLIRQALQGPQRYDYFVLLSGSDYPLKSRQYIHSFFERNRGTEFLNLIKIPNKAAGKPLSRINKVRLESDTPILQCAVKILARLGLAQRDYRKHLGGLEPYAGNTWWALTGEACRYIVDFADSNPAICKYFEKTFSPEESFIHTILGNSQFKPKIHRNLIYEDWPSRGGHPALIGHEHIKMFNKNQKIISNDIWGSEEMLFARKLSDDNLEIANKIDALIIKKSSYI